MNRPAAVSYAVPDLEWLARELDGELRTPLLCVDPAGVVRAAALPTDSPLREVVLIGEPLARLAADEEQALASLLAKGCARVALRAELGGASDARIVPARASGDGEFLDETIRSLAHDLRGPLSTIRGFAALIEQDFAPAMGERGRGYLERLRAGIERVQTLAEGFLELVKSPGASHAERRWVSADDVFRGLRAELKSELEARSIELVLRDDPAPVWADPQRFYQVLLNLVSNSIQHMGSVEHPSIELSVEALAGERVLRVRDNGVGLPPAEHARIAELFARGSRSRDKHLRGLGLAIVQRILEGCGGRVEVESAAALGTTLRCYFPDPT